MFLSIFSCKIPLFACSFWHITSSPSKWPSFLFLSNVYPVIHFKPSFIHMLLFSFSFPFPLFFVNCFDFLCLQTPDYTYFVSPKDFGITFMEEFSCLHFHKAVGRYTAQWIEKAQGSLRRWRLGLHNSVCWLRRHPHQRFLADLQISSAPTTLILLLLRPLSERITFLKEIHLLSNNELWGLITGKCFISLRLFRTLERTYGLRLHTQEIQGPWGRKPFQSFSASTTGL